MIQNQISKTTFYDRYPQIFKETKKIIKNPNEILSFGCSSGENGSKECNTLNNIYYPNLKISGYDISKEAIIKNIKNNKFNNIKYFSSLKNLDNKFDLIFAMSILCMWPESDGEYTFDIFSKTLNSIDKLLKKNGYLCIYNSKYLFSETNLFKKKYKLIQTNHKETGFVTKYHKNNKKIEVNYPYFLFQKIN